MDEDNFSGEENMEAAVPSGNDHANSDSANDDRVPLSALQAERKQRQELQQNLKMMQDHLELMKANQPQKQQVDEFGALQDDDVLTVGEAKKHLQSIKNDYRLSVEELKMQQSYSDYQEVVRNYLPDVLKEDPDLRDEIQNAKNPYKLAYRLAKRSERYLSETSKKQKHDTADRILQNAGRSGSLSAVGSTAPKSSAQGNWKSMSDKDFMAQVHRHMGHV